MSFVFDKLFGCADVRRFSLLQLVWPTETFDVGVITSWHPRYTKSENAQRNKSLYAKLLVARYSLAAARGTYTTMRGLILKPQLFVVVDGRNGGTLLETLYALGSEFEQDGIVFVPAGVKAGTSEPVIIGTKPDDSELRVRNGKKMVLTEGGERAVTLTIDGRPLRLKDECKPLSPPSGMTWWGVQSVAKRNWRDV